MQTIKKTAKGSQERGVEVAAGEHLISFPPKENNRFKAETY